MSPKQKCMQYAIFYIPAPYFLSSCFLDERSLFFLRSEALRRKFFVMSVLDYTGGDGNGLGRNSGFVFSGESATMCP
jgi:hypothetical protein